MSIPLNCISNYLRINANSFCNSPAKSSTLTAPLVQCNSISSMSATHICSSIVFKAMYHVLLYSPALNYAEVVVVSATCTYCCSSCYITVPAVLLPSCNTSYSISAIQSTCSTVSHQLTFSYYYQ